MELICFSFFLVTGLIWQWIEKEKKREEEARLSEAYKKYRWDDYHRLTQQQNRNQLRSQQQEQENERTFGTFVFLDALEQGCLLPPPEDTFPVEDEYQEEDNSDYDESDRQFYSYDTDDEY